MKFGAIIVAAGSGERAGGGLPKQYRMLAGKPVLYRTLKAFLDHPKIGPVVTVTAQDHDDHFQIVSSLFHQDLKVCTGGLTRTESVRAGLDTIAGFEPDAVLIHDAARPFVSANLIDRVVAALAQQDAVIPALPATDALMSIGEDGHMDGAVDRSRVRAAQTPQGFRLAPLLAAYAELGANSLPDDAAVFRRAGGNVAIVDGDSVNFKLTTPDDFDRAHAMLTRDKLTVTGQGFDVHRLIPGERMWLCGVELETDMTLDGHSDADVGLHALTDAVLGAAGAGDIGQHFPPSDRQWKGAASDKFLTHALSLLNEAGGQIRHADITLIAERPKIGPHRGAMRVRVASLLGLPETRVNIKATTTEKLGFTGRGEGIAAQAIVTADIS